MGTINILRRVSKEMGTINILRRVSKEMGTINILRRVSKRGLGRGVRIHRASWWIR
jgi:hypothetical protein